CKFRHLLEQHQLGEQILGQVNLHLQAQGVRITTGTIVDATILHAPTSTKNREQQRDPEMYQTKKGKEALFKSRSNTKLLIRFGNVRALAKPDSEASAGGQQLGSEDVWRSLNCRIKDSSAWRGAIVAPLRCS